MDTIDDLTALVDRKAGMLVDSVSGATASFVPDSTIPDLLGVSVDIEPVQDLHGYDAPWPAGGGVNKFDVGAVTSADFSISNGTFTNVMIADEQLDAVEGYKEFIHHEPQPVTAPVAAE